MSQYPEGVTAKTCLGGTYATCKAHTGPVGTERGADKAAVTALNRMGSLDLTTTGGVCPEYAWRGQSRYAWIGPDTAFGGLLAPCSPTPHTMEVTGTPRTRDVETIGTALAPGTEVATDGELETAREE
jgi:hypothetical protein